MSIEDRDYYEHHKAKDYPMDVRTEEDERKLQDAGEALSLIERFLLERDEALAPGEANDNERKESARIILRTVQELAEARAYAAIAARQPVGEPVAWQWKLRVEGERGWETSLRPISADILNDPECEHRALYTAPPAAVDLAQLRQLEAKFRKYGDGEVGMAFSGPYYSCADELRALIMQGDC